MNDDRLQAAFKQLGWVRIPEILTSMAKQDRLIRTRKRLARLPYHKTLEEFEFSFQPSIDEKRIRELATLRFMGHQENIVFLGPPGVGNYRKTLVMERNERIS